MACVYAQVPIGLGYLGTEAFGLWITIVNATVFLGLGDFGLGLGLQNLIAAEVARERFDEAGRLFRATFTAVCVISIALWALTRVVLVFRDVGQWVQVSDPLFGKALPSIVAWITAAFCLNFPLTLLQRTAYAVQLGWLVAVTTTVTNVVSLVFAFWLSQMQVSIALFCAIPVAAQLVSNIILGIMLVRRLPWLRRSPLTLNLTGLTEVVHKGLLFLIPQISSVVLSVAAPLAIASKLGGEAAAGYNVLLRLASLPCQVIAMVTIPLWAAFTAASARGDHAWIRHAFLTSLRAALVVAMVSCFGLVIFGDFLLGLWLGRARLVNLHLNTEHYIWFGSFCACLCVTPVTSSLMNGMDRLWQQAALGLANAVLTLLLLGPLTQQYGISGAVGTQLAVYIGVNIPFSLIVCRRIVARPR
jgi:O-antigen/teichoic acid export membrane protein